MDYTLVLAWVARCWVQKLHKIIFPCLCLSYRDGQYQLSSLFALDFWRTSFPVAAAFLNLTDEHDPMHPPLNLPTIYSLLFYPLTKKRTFTSDIGILVDRTASIKCPPCTSGSKRCAGGFGFHISVTAVVTIIIFTTQIQPNACAWNVKNKDDWNETKTSPFNTLTRTTSECRTKLGYSILKEDWLLQLYTSRNWFRAAILGSQYTKSVPALVLLLQNAKLVSNMHWQIFTDWGNWVC